jgi:hypothetical protein
MKKLVYILFLILPLSLWSQYQIKSSVFGAGGTVSGGGYVLKGSAYQPHAAVVSGNDYVMKVGFWYRYYKHNVIDEVWVSENYCETCPNDGNAWGYNAYDNISSATAMMEDGGIVHTDGVQTSDDLVLNNFSYTIADGDLVVTGDITGQGCIETLGEGHLVINSGSSPVVFPLCFNWETYFIEISWNGGSQTIAARMNPDSYYNLYSMLGAIWHLEGPDNLNATMKIKIPKAHAPTRSKIEHMLLTDSNRERIWLEYTYEITEETINDDEYWVIELLERVNKF